MNKTVKLIVFFSILVALFIIAIIIFKVFSKDNLYCDIFINVNQSSLSENLYNVERKCEYETKKVEFSTNDKTKYIINDIDYGIHSISSNYYIKIDEDKTLNLELYTDYFHLSHRDANLQYNISINSTDTELEIVVNIKCDRTGEKTKTFESTKKIKVSDLTKPVKMNFYFGS